MKILKTIKEVRRAVDRAKSAGGAVGLVPTMGAFHEGHLSLMKMARRECDLVVVSLFVNPTQFGPQEDFRQYPRDLDKDSLLAERAGADILFVPEPEEIYPSLQTIWIDPGPIGNMLCGAYRPGHFRGVATVVAKLLQIVPAQNVYFGEKDYQQLQIIRQVTKQLNMPVNIRSHPIVRDKDGVALSSRNQYLSPKEKEASPLLYRALREAEGFISSHRDHLKSKEIKCLMEKIIGGNPLCRIQYLAVCDATTLEELDVLPPGGTFLLALAVHVGETRLIDNLVLSR